MAEGRGHVVWTRAAADDLQAIVAHIAASSPASARAVLGKVRRKADTLRSSAERGRVDPELSRFGIQTFREIAVKPYRLMYRIDRRGVVLLAVFDGRRDLEEVLLERLVRLGA